MIDALKRHPQCEDVYRCLVLRRSGSCIYKSCVIEVKVLSSQEEEEQEEEEEQQQQR